MWGDIDEDEGNRRQNELEDIYLKSNIGFRIMRFYDTFESAWRFIDFAATATLQFGDIGVQAVVPNDTIIAYVIVLRQVQILNLYIINVE